MFLCKYLKLCMIIFSCVRFARMCMHTSDFCFVAFSSILNSESTILTNFSMYIIKLFGFVLGFKISPQTT